MENIIGSPARGSNFYKREKEINQIRSGIHNGMHMQIAAPRRVGKTSILQYFIDTRLEGYYFVYLDTESISDENEYYKKLLEELMRCEAFSKTKKIIEQIKEAGNTFLRRIKSVTVLGNSLSLGDSEGVNYHDEFVNFIKGLDLEGHKIIMMIDEFPETILNIYKAHNENTNKVHDFLKSNRALRQDPGISSKILFIYTGSIGLNQTVAKFEGSFMINDLNPVGITQLGRGDALNFISQILNPAAVTMDEQEANYLIDKIEWLIPFHIKLALQEIMNINPPGLPVSNEIIDKAFVQIIEYRNNSFFDHYKSRLNKSFGGNELKFAYDVLAFVANNNSIEATKIYDLAVPYGLDNEYRNVIYTLIYDGYIDNAQDNQYYSFNSPILKMWWKKYVCN